MGDHRLQRVRQGEGSAEDGEGAPPDQPEIFGGGLYQKDSRKTRRTRTGLPKLFARRDCKGESERIVSYSRRYHYPNQWPGDGSDYSLALHAKDLEGFIRVLNAGPVHLVGNSYGGFVVAIVATEHPELVRSVVVGEPAVGVLIKDLPEAKDAWTERTRDIGLMKEAVKNGDSAKATELLYDYVTGVPFLVRKRPVGKFWGNLE